MATMSKRQLLALLGFWVIIFLFLGFPIAWDKWIAIVTGVLVILVAYRKTPPPKSSPNAAFVQSNTQSIPSVEKQTTTVQ
jgi:hypothetical protein